jgi:hypothetical protein
VKTAALPTSTTLFRRSTTLRKPALILASLALAIGLTGCTDDSDVVSSNLSKAADNFEIPRRVVFFNGITDTYLLTVEGACSITDEGNQLEVTCKTGKDEYKKHFLGLSDNVTYFVEQLEGANVSKDHYRVTFKPSVIVPDIDLR